MSALDELDGITRRLRRECPWDREQDERSIVPHTVEEAYELADAASGGDDAKMLDELGDVLFQVHFLALLLEERGAGDLEAVARGTVAKLVRRHPHVFAEAELETSGEVLANWDRIKREQEGRAANEPFADIPETLPALLYARKTLRRAASAGLDGPASDLPRALARARERLAELDRLAATGASAGAGSQEPQRSEVEEAVGDALLALSDAARLLGADPELTLRAAADRLRGGGGEGGGSGDDGGPDLESLRRR